MLIVIIDGDTIGVIIELIMIGDIIPGVVIVKVIVLVLMFIVQIYAELILQSTLAKLNPLLNISTILAINYLFAELTILLIVIVLLTLY